MPLIQVQDDNVKPFVSEGEKAALELEIEECERSLEDRTGEGSDFLGRLRLPSQTSQDEISRVEEAADEIREMADLLVCIGIGGSYLGAQAGIEFLNGGNFEVHFAGHHIASDSLASIFKQIGDRRICLNVISKSGTTMEPALVFRFFKDVVERRHGRAEASKRIFVTTRPKGGALNRLADTEGYRRFGIPDDVGGRFSVLTPVGLLPLAVAGIDIQELLKGAREMEKLLAQTEGIQNNPAWKYAALREALRRQGKTIEILASFQPGLRYILEWWKQLAGESEGKQGRGLFPASVQYTTDLHSLGQWLQEGPRKLFETFLWVEPGTGHNLIIPRWTRDDDGLNYLAGKTLEEINRKAFQGTTAAHREGDVPNLTLELGGRTAHSLGALFYFFQRVIALTGYLLGVNPFDQPGVEMYKKNMLTLLNKPGYEKGA